MSRWFRFKLWCKKFRYIQIGRFVVYLQLSKRASTKIEHVKYRLGFELESVVNYTDEYNMTGRHTTRSLTIYLITGELVFSYHGKPELEEGKEEGDEQR